MNTPSNSIPSSLPLWVVTADNHYLPYELNDAWTVGIYTSKTLAQEAIQLETLAHEATTTNKNHILNYDISPFFIDQLPDRPINPCPPSKPTLQ